MVMNWSIRSAAKRLTYSLLVASAVGGCAVYEPYNPNGGTFADAYPYYPYAQPVYQSAPYYAPYYVTPPASIHFGYESDRHRGSRGDRGDRPGFRRDGVRGERDGSQAGEPRRHQDDRAGDGGRRGNRPEAAAPRQPSDQRSDSVWQELRERRSAEGGGR